MAHHQTKNGSTSPVTMEGLIYDLARKYRIPAIEVRTLLQKLTEVSTADKNHAVAFLLDRQATSRGETAEAEHQRLRHELDDTRAQLSRMSELAEFLIPIAYRDKLTGLYRHDFFEERLADAILRETEDWIAIGFVDLWEFKWFNDNIGYVAGGNTVLTTVAEILKEHLRPTDFPTRWGGDEFAFFIWRLSKKKARDLAQRFKNAVSVYDWGRENLAFLEHPPRVDVGIIFLKLGPREERERIATVIKTTAGQEGSALMRTSRVMKEAKRGDAELVLARPMMMNEDGQLVEIKE